jgi:UDP-GlcNAc:undecaprenyl-phosphate GlcNAc-1-phosphate transferase
MKSFVPSAVITLISSFGLGGLLTWAILRLSSRWPSLARTSSNRLHAAPTPVWGGVAIFLAFMCVALLRGMFNQREVVVAAVSASGIFLLGLADDLWKLRPRWKLLGQMLCSLNLLTYLYSQSLTGNKLIDIPIALVWMIGITNAFNLLDNINGLSSGTGVLVSGFLATMFLDERQMSFALLSFAVGGAILGFLIFNFPKGRIFMGDSGSLFIGFWLAAAMLAGANFSAKNHLRSFLFPLLVMIVPICDTTLVTLTRIMRGRPISVGGTDHFSHRLVAYGFSEKSAVEALWLLSFLSGVLGIFAVLYGLPRFFTIVTLLFAAVVLFCIYLARFELSVQPISPQEVARRPRIVPWLRISVRVLFDAVLIVVAYYTAYTLRFDGKVGNGDIHLLVSTSAELMLIKLGVLCAFGAYRPSWEYFGLKDGYRLGGASVLASIIAVSYFSIVYRFYGFSRIVIVLDFLVFTLLVLAFRFSYRLFDELAPANHRTNALICGADTLGETVLQIASKHYRFRVVGFLDDDNGKRSLSIHSVPIRGCTQDLERIAKLWNVRVVLLSPSATEETSTKLQTLCRSLGMTIMRLRLELEGLEGAADTSLVQPFPNDSIWPKTIADAAQKALSKQVLLEHPDS